jgi:RNA polymerase sigma factor (sigma-70 family)
MALAGKIAAGFANQDRGGRAEHDLQSAATEALLRAVDKFKLRKGCRLSTYAFPVIQRAVVITLRRSRTRDSHEAQRCAIAEAVADSLPDESAAAATTRLMATASLSPVERRVICLRFGVGEQGEHAGSPLTLEVVGILQGVSKERIRQIQEKALAKMRAVSKENL